LSKSRYKSLIAACCVSANSTIKSKLYKTTLLVFTKIAIERYLFLLVGYNQPYPNGFIWSLPQTVCSDSLGANFNLETAIEQELGINAERYDLNYFDLAQTGMVESEDERLAIIEIAPQQFITLSAQYQKFTWCRDCECGKLQELYLIDLATFAILERGKQLIKNDFCDTSMQQSRGNHNYQSSNLVAA
jgi:hypothetical protein